MTQVARDRSDERAGQARHPSVLRLRSPSRTRRIRHGFLIIGLAATGLYLLLPVGIPRDVGYLVLGLAGVGAILLGVRLNHPPDPRPWFVMALGQFVWVVGDTVSSYSEDIAHVDDFPAPADAFYLAAYPILFIALVLLIRNRRPRRDLAGVLDSLVVTAGFGLLSWTLLARPTWTSSMTSLSAAFVGAAYPVADIVLAGILVRLVVTRGGRTQSFRLLLGAVVLLITADTISTALSVYTGSSTSTFDVLWLASYVLWGAAALDPSMVTLSERAPSEAPAFSLARLLALGIAVLIPPAMLAVQQAAGFRIDVWAIVVGSVLMLLLVVARTGLAVEEIVAAGRVRAQLQADLAHQAAHDPLTHLPNRAQTMNGLTRALQRAQRSGASLALLFIDLDSFKAVNDTFGHRAGDEVLRTAAQRMQACVRGGDAVGRLGGDEFVVLLEPVESETEALDIADRIVSSLSEPIDIGGSRRAHIGASVGIALSLDATLDPEALLHEADTAVYRAKVRGRGRVEIFGEGVRHELAERSHLTTGVTDAIRDDALILHFQPIVELDTGRIRGHEALVRYETPGGRLIEPGAFIDAASESDLICDLDAWVLRSALDRMPRTVDVPGATPLTLSVNIASRYIASSRILADVRAALEASAVAPERVYLELTESGFDDNPVVLHHLAQLRDLGVRVSMDDFGTGHQSVRRLQRLPVDEIKIDKTMLDLSEDGAQALLRLTIDIAHTFGLPVVAEGVEHRRQLELLRSLHCDAAQGFYFARPSPNMRSDAELAC